jgi:phosphonopyruvate decarboxylase
VLTGPVFATLLRGHGFAFAAGVPCSLIEDLIRTLEAGELIPYVPAVREDIAVGLAAGAWLAGRRPVVLMQNSGLGTSMNALASLSLMYGLPLLLVVTWRGYQGKDAPEHVLTGAITERHLSLLGIPHRVLGAASAADDVAWAAREIDTRSQPVALLVPPAVFESAHGGESRGPGGVRRLQVLSGEGFASSRRPTSAPHAPGTAALPAMRGARSDDGSDEPLVPRISRFAAIRAAVKQLGNEPLVHANGYPSRESHAVADRPQNFYMIGSMGLASAIALGVALNRPSPATVVFDGDGNLLMNLGILPMVGARAPKRFLHCVFDNEVYGSTGNQMSAAAGVRLDVVAAAAGYRTVAAAVTEDDVARHVATALASDGPHFLLIKVTPEQADVPRIAHTPAQIRDRFRASLASS